MGFKPAQERLIQAFGFGAENEDIPSFPFRCAITLLGFGREESDVPPFGPGPKCICIGVFRHLDVLPIVQTRAPHRLVVGLEAQWVDQMEVGANPQAQATNVPGVGSDLGVHERNMKDGFHAQLSSP
jgi:hypothetical protein